jgi:hypothetical protein
MIAHANNNQNFVSQLIVLNSCLLSLVQGYKSHIFTWCHLNSDMSCVPVGKWITIPLRNKNKLTIKQSSGYDSRFGTQLREAPGSSPGWDHSFAPISLSIASILGVQWLFEVQVYSFLCGCPNFAEKLGKRVPSLCFCLIKDETTSASSAIWYLILICISSTLLEMLANETNDSHYRSALL